jgi:hypothetical protein
MLACRRDSMRFEMRIMNVFRLSNGRTVFGGLVSGHPELVRACKCELQFEGECRQKLECEGEQIALKHSQNDLRAIGTVEHVSLTPDEAQSGGWKLICSEYE